MFIHNFIQLLFLSFSSTPYNQFSQFFPSVSHSLFLHIFVLQFDSHWSIYLNLLMYVIQFCISFTTVLKICVVMLALPHKFQVLYSSTNRSALCFSWQTQLHWHTQQRMGKNRFFLSTDTFAAYKYSSQQVIYSLFINISTCTHKLYL